MGVVKFKRDLIFPGLASQGPGAIEFVQRSFNISAAQIATLNAAPPTLILAPSANQIVIVDSILFQFKYPSSGGVQFTGGGAITFVYHGTSIAVHSGAGIPASAIQAAANYLVLLPPISANLVATAGEGLGVDMVAAGANFAAGNGTAVVTVVFSIVNLQ